jgi:hypothetical protein
MIIRSKKKKKTVSKIVTITVFVAVIAAAYLTGRLMSRDLADKYSSEVFPFLSSLPQKISALTDVSITEITVVVLGCLALPVLIVWLVLLVKKAMTRGVGKFLYKSFRNILAVAMVVLIIFEMMHGINYRRTPARTLMGLGQTKISFEDYCAAFEWAYDGMVKARKELKEDENGVAQLSTDFEETARYASEIIDTFCASYGIAKYKSYTRPKSVRLSHYWSYTYIVGMYNPAYGEANINTDYMDATTIPSTICHELCHTKGFANETDCNLVGALACLTSERADFRYCGYYTVFISLLNQIENLKKTKGFKYDYKVKNDEIRPVARDTQAANDYWKKIDKEVDDIQKRFGINITEQASEANNKFLQSNGEKEGTDTYNVPENVYVDFYLKYVASGSHGNA